MNADQLLDVADAHKIILKNKLSFTTENIPLQESMGRILMESIKADRDFPPFNRVMMDGIAVDYSALEGGRTDFKIAGLQPAGSMQQQLTMDSDCIEVMTGAVLPMYADTVIPYEKLKIANGTAKLLTEEVRKGQHVHLQGADHKRGDLLIMKGGKITAAEIAVIASVGKRFIDVLAQPKVAIVSTGDELVEIDDMPAPHQIRKSNSYAIMAALGQSSIPTDRFHLHDDRDEIKSKLSELISTYDVVLLSGGVSKGKKDFVPEVLNELKVKALFHGVAQRPGKPLWFGKKEKTIVFGFPGNPVSTFLCFYRYFIPWLRASQGLKPAFLKAVLNEDIEFKPALTYFLQVKLQINDEGKLMAIPSPGNGSGDLANLTNADGFIELPAEKDSFIKGSVYPLIRYRF